MANLEYQLESGYRFAVFGDQRALANGEWQLLLNEIAQLETPSSRELPLLFLLDTGDIVQDGAHSDQFRLLQNILRPVEHLPYLIGVGNHEISNNEPGPARANLATFAAYLDPQFSAERMFYRKDLGGVAYLFLNTSDLVYDVPEGANARADGQLAWLVEELANPRGTKTTVIVMHHPFIQTSKKHRPTARDLWKLEYQNKTLPNILADGGVDVVLTGHTHTYERFELTRRHDGRRMHVVNVSGRPRNAFLWFGAGSRRPKDVRGKEDSWFTDEGWEDASDWEIRQREFMDKDSERNQTVVFTVDDRAQLSIEVHYLTDPEDGGLTPGGQFELH